MFIASQWNRFQYCGHNYYYSPTNLDKTTSNIYIRTIKPCSKYYRRVWHIPLTWVSTTLFLEGELDWQRTITGYTDSQGVYVFKISAVMPYDKVARVDSLMAVVPMCFRQYCTRLTTKPPCTLMSLSAAHHTHYGFWPTNAYESLFWQGIVPIKCNMIGGSWSNPYLYCSMIFHNIFYR